MTNPNQQLSAEKERYRVIAELTSDYAYSLRADSETKVVLDWANGAYSRLTGLGETDLHRGVTQARWIKTAHTGDRTSMQKRVDTLLSGESITTEYKVVSKTGETRWLRDVGRPILDDNGRVIRIYCAAQDITEDMRKAELIDDRTLDPKALCGNLRKFRHKLKLSQKVFGQTFGEYSQRQITSYETGESEIPLGLLLRIRDAGYPLDVVLGEGKTTALDQVVGYFEGPPPQPKSFQYVALLGIKANSTLAIRKRVEAGFSFRSFEKFQRTVALPTGELAMLIQVNPRTLTRRKAEGRFQPDESDRLLRASRLFQMAVDLFEGDLAAARRWFASSKKALGGKTPLDFARTEVGAREVENLIGRLEYGVYS